MAEERVPNNNIGWTHSEEVNTALLSFLADTKSAA
jgi:hypothetical protein